MALGRRALSEVRYVLRDDPSIDPDSHAAYVESGYEWSKLRLLPDMGEPTVFKLRPLTHRQKGAAYSRSGFSLLEFAFRCGVVGIEHYLVQRQDGSEYDLAQPVREDSDSGQLISTKWMDEANILTTHMSEVGNAVLVISELARPLSRPSGAQPGPAE